VHSPAVLQVCPLPQSAAMHFTQVCEKHSGITGEATWQLSKYTGLCFVPREEQDALVATALQTPF